MRHATIWAIAVLANSREVIQGSHANEFAYGWRAERQACDWERPCLNDGFFGSDARFLLGETGPYVEKDNDPPDCPTCALFVDLALIARGEAQQELVNAALDAERKLVAA